jgi:hypothetical protein
MDTGKREGTIAGAPHFISVAIFINDKFNLKIIRLPRGHQNGLSS